MTIAAMTGMEAGYPYPLGATFDGKGVNFALFSAHAERVELCLFDERGNRELRKFTLPAHTDQVFHGYLEHARPGLLYGYRVYGPYDPKGGHRFNHHKLLLDPYARQLVGPFRWTDAHFGYRVGAATADLTFDTRNNAARMPKCAVVDGGGSRTAVPRPATPLSRSFIYEAHVRGLTKLHPDVPEAWRGTFLGVSSDAMLEHFTKLGVTAVELLPVHAFVDDRFLVERGLHNYWGYNSLNFFSPSQRYLSGTAGIDDFRIMVQRFHAAGIEVFLDVVYNHTAEGNELGPTLSFKGIDNKSYYRLIPPDPRYYINETGTGNTFNTSHPRVLQLVMDSLRYWTHDMGVDGFRFDLATTVAREPHGYEPGSGFLDAVRQDPALQHVKLIAEPWDVGPGGYQLGQFPAGWSEWNDVFRDATRCYWRGDEDALPNLARVVSGTSDKFDHNRRSPQASINFITSHDGFNLHDLVSYNHKHNEANGDGNSDGHDANHSFNHGAEGPTDDAEILRIRERQKRNMLMTLFLSQGVPMMLMGDEIGHTQRGNNNAYCQDNEIAWLNWDAIDERGWRLFDFVRRLARLRRDHPALRATHFLHGERVSEEGLKDIYWIDGRGDAMQDQAWNETGARLVGMRLNGRVVSPDSDPPEAVLLVYFNASEHNVEVTLPSFESCRGWRRLIDTTEREEGGAVMEIGVETGSGEQAHLARRSVTLFVMVDKHGHLPERM
jgi:isoamylase